MTRVLEGELTGEGRRIAVAVAAFNGDVTSNLLAGCLGALRRHGVAEEDTLVTRVPGAFELPGLCERLAARGRFHAIVALGAVIRGETPHFGFVAAECARGLMEVSLRHGVPVAFGVLTTDDLTQARARSDPGETAGSSDPDPARREKTLRRSNKGAEAAETALRMASLLDRLP